MKKWEIVYKNQKSKIKNQKFDSEEIIQILLENRGLKTKEEIDEFLNPKLENVNAKTVGIDMKQLSKAIKRIQKAIEKKEKVIIFGDYDVDGICGTALLWEALYSNYNHSFSMNKNVFPYIPHRIDEGYGLSIKGIDRLLENHPDTSLIITVDNGVVANEAVDYAKGKNIDVIITDHHIGVSNFPDSYAVVHTTKLCGAGVAYMLAHEMRSLNPEVRNDSKEGLEFVALATVADLVPLISHNRTLLKFGLESLRRTKRVGLLELFAEASIQKEKIGVYEIGYIIAPRINAMGRLFHGMDSLRLLCTKNVQKAREYAQKLGLTNRERQLLTEESSMHAKQFLRTTISQSKIAFVAHNYNAGVIGLIASKLVEEYYRPSFAISIGEIHSKGSARSISGVNIIELIRSVSHTLIQAGGHPMAAGFTVETSRIEEFRLALSEKALEIVTDDHLLRKLKIDMEIDLSVVTLDLYKRLLSLSPFGIGNPEPTFVSYGTTIEDVRILGREGKHLKLKISNKSEALSVKSEVIEAIAFGMGEKASELSIGDKVDIAYTIDLNEWNGSKKLQLKIKDINS